jgi:hypothetical protein
MGNIERAQLAEWPGNNDAPHKGPSGYFACYRDRMSGEWVPAGMRVYETRADAMEWVRKHHPKASEWGTSAFVPRGM